MSKNGTKKYGRNKRDCERYKLENRHEKSKAVKLVKHLRRVPTDTLAKKAYETLPEFVKKGRGNLSAPSMAHGERG